MKNTTPCNCCGAPLDFEKAKCGFCTAPINNTTNSPRLIPMTEYEVRQKVLRKIEESNLDFTHQMAVISAKMELSVKQLIRNNYNQ